MFKINWASVLIGAIGLIIGFYLNMYASKISNAQLLAELKAELEKLKQEQKINQSRITRKSKETIGDRGRDQSIGEIIINHNDIYCR